ncbi:MAG: Na+/H+ antiporter NhaA [Proteobacteria bacterium]|nr:Na+/H+ antiporter NhaA [Pseudomonadota bacterium]
MPARAFARFLSSQYFGSGLLLLATALALVIANCPVGAIYHEILHGDIGFAAGSVSVHMSLAHWINEGLMVLFFLVVGLEIKREFLHGELSRASKAFLPVICAAGGVIVPALIFMLINRAEPDHWRGWAIPTATDIAFALGLLALGGRIPLALKVFLAALAIIDDLIAILIIALFYGGPIHIDPFLFAAGIMFCLFALNLMRITQLWPYLMLGLVLWVAVLQSGLSPTLAGVLLAIMIPVGDRRDISPLHRLEDALQPLCAYFIMPIFAFANAGLSLKGISLADFFAPLTLGIILALFFGKQAGIFLAGLAAARMKWAKLPEGASLLQLYGVAVLAGVGFTMSLFLGTLAFPDEALWNQARLGVICGSLLSAVVGITLLRFAKPTR